MAIDDVKETIRKGNQALHDARISIEKANAQLGEATSLAIMTLHDSRHHEAQQSRRALREAADEVELALRRVQVAREHAAAYLSIIG